MATEEKKKGEGVGHKTSSSKPLKIVYIGNTLHNQWEVTDDKPESRKNPVDGSDAHCVAPSSYDRTAVNYEITQEDIDDYSVLKGRALPGDIVDEREFNNLVGKENKEHPDIPDEHNKTDEELNQDE